MAANENERSAAIDLLLRKLHVCSMNPAERTRLAQGLAAVGLTESRVRRAWDECRTSSRDDDAARGLFVITIRQPALVLEIDADLADKDDRMRGAKEGSDIRFVSETNPYGWSQPESMTHFDHSEPGKWNPYRQSTNLTVEEAREAGRTDVRRHGCSRWEVLGYFDKKRIKADAMVVAALDYDSDLVALVRGADKQNAAMPVTPTPPSSTDPGRVYGEPAL